MNCITKLLDRRLETGMVTLNGNILIVDEGVGFCRSLAGKLANRGYRVDFTFDVQSVAPRILNSEVDLVVLSCAGEVGCKENIEKVREINENIPIISFGVPSMKEPCDFPKDETFKIVCLNSWDAAEAAPYVGEFIEEVLKKANDAAATSQLLFGEGKQVDVQILGIHKTGVLNSSIASRDEQYLYLKPIKDITNLTYKVPVRTSLRIGVAGKDAHYSFTGQIIDITEKPEMLIQMYKPVVIYRTQRRKHQRLNIKTPVSVAVFCDDCASYPLQTKGFTEDISRGGVKLSVPEYIDPGEVITIDIASNSEKSWVHGTAYVLRTTPAPLHGKECYTVACKFSKIDKSIEELLDVE